MFSGIKGLFLPGPKKTLTPEASSEFPILELDFIEPYTEQMLCADPAFRVEEA